MQKRIHEHVQLMKSLYEQALEFGEMSMQHGADLEELSDRRHRILNRTRALWEELEALVVANCPLSPADQAFVDECKRSLKDLLPRFKEQDLRMKKAFDQRLGDLRKQMASSSQNLRVARSYAGMSHREVWH